MDVVHDEARSRFVLTVDGHEVVADYALGADGSVDFTHTYTPPALRGRGLAAVVVDAALAWARAGNRTITASCWYVREYLAKEAK